MSKELQMRRLYLLLFIAALLIINCRKADNSDNYEIIENSPNKEVSAEYTIFTQYNNISIANTKLTNYRINLINALLNGINYNYNSDGTLEIISEGELIVEEYRLLEQKREFITEGNFKLMLEKGTIKYQSSEKNKGLKFSSSYKLRKGVIDFGSGFNKLVIKAIKEKAQKGNKGKIYLDGSIKVTIKPSEITMESDFIIIDNEK